MTIPQIYAVAIVLLALFMAGFTMAIVANKALKNKDAKDKNKDQK